jgi:hypothetical protein
MGSFALLRVKSTFVWWISAIVGMQQNDNIIGVCFAKLGVLERQKKRTTRTNHTQKITQKHMQIHWH